MAESEFYIQLENVTYRRGGVVLLNNVSFGLVAGEFASLGGSDISGKSSLLKLCIGLIKPDSGTVLVNGRPINELSYDQLQEFRHKTGFVFQSGVLLSNLNIRDNVALPLRYHTQLGERDIDKQVDKYLELLNITVYAKERPAGLPDEIKLMASLARALIVGPRLLMLDEFFDSVSGFRGEKAVQHLKDIKNATKMTGISTTKTVNLLTSFVEEPLIDCIMLIEAGGIVEEGRCQAVREKLMKKLM
ncbi:MAG: ATP-binding cassette domain-containing protein [Candidatus Brocadiia bacterium]